AVAAAAYLAKLHNAKRRIVASAGLHPHTLATLRTHALGFGAEVVEVPLRDGVTDAAAWAQAIDAQTSAAIFAQPNFYGAVEDARALSEAAKQAAGAETAAAENGRGALKRAEGGAPSAGERGPVVIAQVDPITLGVLAPPGECGVDVAVGEGQALGNRLDF